MASSSGGDTNKTVLVTVGTTRFDELICAVDSPEFAEALVQRGYTSLVIQAGASEGYRPHRLFSESNREKKKTSGSDVSPVAAVGGRSSTLPSGLRVEWFEYAPSLGTYLDSASLVVSHAGAGSIFETLRKRIPLITVPNAALMDNHQQELAAKLQEMGHLAAASPETLVHVILSLDTGSFAPYEAGDGVSIVKKVDEVCRPGAALQGKGK